MLGAVKIEALSFRGSLAFFIIWTCILFVYCVYITHGYFGIFWNTFKNRKPCNHWNYKAFADLQGHGADDGTCP